ncbi:DUF3515 family protein [Agromyces sp. SYSU T00194]|uniref:DUF3515 family protein n=1 Tax=Agromyces chitinivorans TaxID=3158560 RepID=UPI0033935902
MPSSPSRPAAALVAALLGLPLALALAGCTRTVALEPADDAIDTGCADIVVRLPDEVAGQPQRPTDAQGTGAWGDPAAVLLRCGVEPPAPTTLECVDVNGVDWIIDDADAPRYVFTTYGRVPATEVIVDSDLASGTSALTDLALAVSSVPAERACVGADELLDE